MKARDQSFTGTWVLTKNGAYFNSGTAAALRFRCTPGAMVQGDFKTANNWSYTVLENRWWKGQLFKKETSGQKVLHEYNGYHGAGTNNPEPSWDRSMVYNRALEKLNSKVRGDLDLSIALAESRTTWKMIRSITKVVDYVRAVKRRFGSTKDLANGWLQWQYGWKPLVSDLFNVLDQRRHIVLTGLWNTRARATERMDRTSAATRTDAPYLGGIAVPVKRVTTGKQSCTFRLVLEIPFDQDLAKWTSLNPVSIAWELTPYSFVFDWFFDVGTYLRNVETAFLYGTQFREGYVSELFAVDLVDQIDPAYTKTNYLGYTSWFPDCTWKLRSRRFVRTRLTSYPLPRPPSFKVDLGSQRMLSAAALLRQLLK